jgi:DnaK suppressor protein
MDRKNQLLSKKRQLQQTIQQKKDSLMIPLSESVDDLSMYDQHPADIGSEVYEREKDAGLLELMELELQKVNDALKRFEEGTYGICENCGNPIEAKRLDRVINTTLCSQCARQAQDDFRRPAEEDITLSGAMADRGEAFEIAGYDFYDE